MTRYVCSHHIGFALWLSINIVITILLGLTLNEWSQYNFKIIPDSISNITQQNQYFITTWDSMDLCFELIILVSINCIGLYFANGRYHWIGLKECSRK